MYVWPYEKCYNFGPKQQETYPYPCETCGGAIDTKSGGGGLDKDTEFVLPLLVCLFQTADILK